MLMFYHIMIQTWKIITELRKKCANKMCSVWSVGLELWQFLPLWSFSWIWDLSQWNGMSFFFFFYLDRKITKPVLAICWLVTGIMGAPATETAQPSGVLTGCQEKRVYGLFRTIQLHIVISSNFVVFASFSLLPSSRYSRLWVSFL